MRSRYKVVTNEVIKNFHLPSIDHRCFTGFTISLPSLKAWIAPSQIRKKYEKDAGFYRPVVEILPPETGKFELHGNRKLSLNVYSRFFDGPDPEGVTLYSNVALEITFEDLENFDEVKRITKNLDFIFCFLIGRRLAGASTFLNTNASVDWSEEKRTIVAEAIYHPAWKRDLAAPHRRERMSVQQNSPISLVDIVNFCISDRNERIFYFMNMVQAVEMQDLKIDDVFIELVGCLEEMDIIINGNRCGRKKPTLRDRLFRLVQPWRADGFYGNPDLNPIVKLRNKKPHGRGNDLGTDDINHIIYVTPFLAALLRYHIMKVLGFARSDIGLGFARVRQNYGFFTPDEFGSRRIDKNFVYD